MYTHDLFYLQQEWKAWLAPVYKQAAVKNEHQRKSGKRNSIMRIKEIWYIYICVCVCVCVCVQQDLG